MSVPYFTEGQAWVLRPAWWPGVRWLSPPSGPRGPRGLVICWEDPELREPLVSRSRFTAATGAERHWHRQSWRDWPELPAALPSGCGCPCPAPLGAQRPAVLPGEQLLRLRLRMSRVPAWPLVSTALERPSPLFRDAPLEGIFRGLLGRPASRVRGYELAPPAGGPFPARPQMPGSGQFCIGRW